MELDKDVIQRIGKLLDRKTVATAESVTAGQLQFMLSQIENAAVNFKGGITAYTLEEKVNLLGIDKDEARECDCVSSQIAEDMALQASHLFNADFGIGVTGYATPVEESHFKLYAYFAISYKMQIIVSEKTELSKNFLGAKAQQKYGENILVTFEGILAKLF
ncbi:nicotinamide-nucleotide amidohydrolase family protein [Sphingobacterium paramultivorum]|uniref:Nicotinamide-nucleotide amidohydrolase family protein n=1 Tax=Sphingobacterium paramultivorum TaxID=2886510 RepID=A0A7G5E1V6_9SPHI|nr:MULTISPECIES: nicotinamide-nucleotide amidohydrolase family protein [Sphingobacterium]MCS4167917.1 PncC family amidohydrolase [Sphingobacterium sp. BIGb0116]QMV67981.1 nicotinamide-nucleotide amidohydrolase family protein [Sphingobacterium paramultivorum]WSO16881.1 nicotinamide-nucleotide amidohydrolase family protein [Sphingobacterium paramultivorum]